MTALTDAILVIGIALTALLFGAEMRRSAALLLAVDRGDPGPPRRYDRGSRPVMIDERLRHPPGLEPAHQLTPDVLDFRNTPSVPAGPRTVRARSGGGSLEGSRASR